MEVCVAVSGFGDRVKARRGDLRAIAAEVGVAEVVRQHDDHIRGVLGRCRPGRPPRSRPSHRASHRSLKVCICLVRHRTSLSACPCLEQLLATSRNSPAGAPAPSAHRSLVASGCPVGIAPVEALHAGRPDWSEAGHADPRTVRARPEAPASPPPGPSSGRPVLVGFPTPW